MFRAYSTIGGKDYLAAEGDNLANLIYNVCHTHALLTDPEPCIIKDNGKTLGTITFDHLTVDGREVYVTYPKGARKLIKFSVSLEDFIEKGQAIFV